MFDADASDEAVALISLLAGAVRNALGEEIDAYPGLRVPEQGDPLNRAFLAIAHAVLRKDATDAADAPARVSRVLRQVAEQRLATEGWDDHQLRLLIEQEPGSPADWLVFLILSSREQIEPLLGPGDLDPD